MLTVIIVNWNTCALLEECLRSILDDQILTSDHVIETIVVDNGSNDGSVEMVREQFPEVVLIKNDENLGFTRANNQGITASHGQYVLLLNSDTRVHSDAFSAMLSFMESHPLSGACGPRLLNGDGSLQAACQPMITPNREFWRLIFMDKYWPKASYPMSGWNISEPRQVEVIKGACLMLRRQTLEQVGLLDERYFMYTEEVDLCYRLVRAGWQLWYVPTAVVTHYGEASSSQQADDSYLQLYRSKVQFFRKIGGPYYARWFKLLVLLAYIPRAIMRPRDRIYRRLLTELPVM